MKKIFMVLMAAAITFPALADSSQKDPAPWEKMQSIKIGYLTSEIGLTPEEAQLFWPVYNQAESEIHQLQKSVFEAQKAIGEALKAGNKNADYSALVKEYLDVCSQRDVIGQKYFEKFKKVLSPEKLARYYMAEENFRRDQIRQLQGNYKKPAPQQGQKPQPGRGFQP